MKYSFYSSKGKYLIKNNSFAKCFIAVLFLLFLLLFYLPKIDIGFSKLFYLNEAFIYKNNDFAVILFKSIPMLTKIFVAVIALVFCSSILSKNLKLISISLFFLLSAAIGPGLLVNELFKNHFGRPRPDNVIEFGGKYEFIRPLEFSESCKKNCSFSCGHASMGYYFTSISYLFKEKKQVFKLVFSLFFLFGSIVGLMRIMQGRHFLSDVIFSAFIIALTNHIVSFCFLKNIKT